MKYREAATNTMKAINKLLFILGLLMAMYLVIWCYCAFICAVLRLPFHICKYPAIVGTFILIFSLLSTDS